MLISAHGRCPHPVGQIPVRAKPCHRTPLAITVTFAPMESPSFQRAHQFVQRVKFVRIGTKERIKLNLTPVFNLNGMSPIWVRRPRISINFSAGIFLAIAPAATRIAVFTRGRTSTATVIAQAVFLLIGVIRVSRTKNIFNRAVVLRR